MSEKKSAVPESFRSAVSAEALLEDSRTLSEYVPAGHSGPRPAAVIRPADPAQVESVVRAAASAGVNLVAVSSGPPHRKGGTTPSADGVVIDLSEMREILHFDRRNKVAVIEPGVTFEQLRARVDREGLRPLLPLMPRATKSVLASYLEREPFVIPKYHWDTTDPLLCVEVVFGTGDVFRTGSAAGPGTLEQQWARGNAQKNPMGPAATDFLKLVQGAQGTMGIVTWASVKLELKPTVRHFRFVTCERVKPLLEMAREMLRRRLGDEVLLLDDANLSRALARSAESGKEKWKVIDPFVLVYGVAGYAGLLPEERVHYQERDIDDIARGMGLKPLASLGGADGEDIARLLDGVRAPGNWKVTEEEECRDVFFLTTMDRVPAFIDTMTELATRNGTAQGSLGTYVQPILQGRSCHLEFNLFYDPADDEASAAARKTAEEASEVMAGMGAFFSRPSEPWVDIAYERCGDTVDALRKVKAVFDPRDIMNRGKLCFKGGVADGAR